MKHHVNAIPLAMLSMLVEDPVAVLAVREEIIADPIWMIFEAAEIALSRGEPFDAPRALEVASEIYGHFENASEILALIRRTFLPRDSISAGKLHKILTTLIHEAMPQP